MNSVIQSYPQFSPTVPDLSGYEYFPHERKECFWQCDQIWRFFGIWATFQSLWQQLICPNILHSYTIFCKGVKIFHFSSEIIFGQLLQTFGNFLLVTLVFGKIKAL